MGSSAVASFGGGFIWCLATHVVHALTQWLTGIPVFPSSILMSKDLLFKISYLLFLRTWKSGNCHKTSVVILFHILNVALVLRQDFPATSGEAEVVVFLNMPAVSDLCVAISGIDQALRNLCHVLLISLSNLFTSSSFCSVQSKVHNTAYLSRAPVQSYRK